MCVIIEKYPGTTLPSDKMEIACDVNKHGYGIAYVHKGRIRTIKKAVAGKNNDPGEILDILQPLKDKRVFIHLRHATVGDVCDINAHPFDVSPSKRLDIGLMHNGTLYDFTPAHPNKEGYSDTLLFATNLVTPFLKRMHAFAGVDVLKDIYTREVLKKFLTNTSVVVLYDQLGNVIKLNESAGKEFEGWWASNTYSFNDQHLRSSKRSTQTYNYTGYNHQTHEYRWPQDYDNDLPWKKQSVGVDGWANWDDFCRKADIKKVTSEQAGKGEQFELECIAARINLTQMSEKSVMTTVGSAMSDLSVKIDDFTKRTGLSSITEVMKLSKADLEELCETYPKGAAVMVIELCAEIVRLSDKKAA